MVGTIIGFSLLGLVVFVALREVACWYWKQSEILQTLRNIEALLREERGEEPAEQDGKGQGA